MSLKTFHLFFITVAVLLCAGFGIWCIAVSSSLINAKYVAAALSFIVAAGLIVYESWFVHKIKKIEISHRNR